MFLPSVSGGSGSAKRPSPLFDFCSARGAGLLPPPPSAWLEIAEHHHQQQQQQRQQHQQLGSGDSQTPISSTSASGATHPLLVVDEISASMATAAQYEWRVRARDNPIVELEDRALWTEFFRHTTEMVITKTGRRMFPAFKVRVKGLDPSAKYVMLLDIVLANENRYKYYHNQWIKSGKAEVTSHQGNPHPHHQGHGLPPPPHHYPHYHGGSGHSPYVHPDSPSTGEDWMSKPISFHKIKLSNTRVDKDDVIILNSMHKYIPRLYLARAQNLQHSHYCNWEEYSFEETQFVAVTAYQNDQITKLKINYNPFAKGFRESSSLKKVKRALSDFEIPGTSVHKSMHNSMVSDFVLIRNKYFKQFALRNKNLSRSFPFVSRPLEYHTGINIDLNKDNTNENSKPDEDVSKPYKHGFLISDLLS